MQYCLKSQEQWTWNLPSLVTGSLGQSLLSLALLFLLVTAPDFGTFDPVLVSLHPLPSWCSHKQSGQKTKLHLDELHSARDDDTLEGDVHSGQWVNLSPGLSLRASSTKSLCLTLLGETSAATLPALSLFPPLPLPPFPLPLLLPLLPLWLSSCCITRLGEAGPSLLGAVKPSFSWLRFLTAIQAIRRSLCSLLVTRAKFHN